MKNTYTKSGYQITDDPSFQDTEFGNTPDLKKLLQTLPLEAQDKKNKKIIDKLTQLIIENPLSPQLKNYLSVAYNTQGNYAKAIEVNNWILAEHPNYLFAKLNQVNSLINSSNFDEVHAVLGEAMELKALYPNREVFYFSEITNFYKTVIRYYAAIQNLELAENRLELLKQIAPEHHDTEESETFLFTLRLKKAGDRIKERQEARITPIRAIKELATQTKIAPTFNHEIITKLYESDFYIEPYILEQIMALPRATLIADLELMLLDAEQRFEYYCEDDWTENTHTFPLHAIFLLAEIEANKSLPKIMLFLQNNDEFMDYWVADHRTETLWRCYYKLGINNISTLQLYLLNSNFETFIKSGITSAMSQMVMHYPEKRAEVLQVFNEVLTTYNNANRDDNLIDSAFLGLAIGDAVHCGLTELLPIIKQLYEKKYVDLDINGDYKEVEKQYKKALLKDYKCKIYSITELYHHIVTSWYGYKKDNSIAREYNDVMAKEYFSQTPFVNTEPKINRNDPCTCGSGKKYKKCHGANS